MSEAEVTLQPCTYVPRGTCTRSPCEYWHSPECQFYKTESGCNAADKCLFPHHKVDEQPNISPNRATIPTKEEKAKKKRCSYCEYCPTIGLCLCEQYTHKYSTYRVAQHDLIASRERASLKSWKAQDCTSLCPYNKCHPRVMSPSLPHLTLTTSTSSLSPISSTSPIFPTVSPAHKTYDSRPRFTLRCSTAEWRINTNPISHRF